MLAKDIKIRNIKRQREFIEEQLKGFFSNPRKDGDTLYRYLGHIFPEVLHYFTKEGFRINCYDSEKVIFETKGYPIYVFTVSDGVELNEEETQEAEEVEYEEESFFESMKAFAESHGMMN